MTHSKNYIVYDVKKIKTAAQLKKLSDELLRVAGFATRPNMDQERSYLNETVEGENTTEGILEYRDFVLKEKGVKERPNGVKALSFILSYSHEMENKINKSDWIEANRIYMSDKFGASNILTLTYHGDEKTGHLHCMVLPLLKENTGRFKGR